MPVSGTFLAFLLSPIPSTVPVTIMLGSSNGWFPKLKTIMPLAVWSVCGWDGCEVWWILPNPSAMVAVTHWHLAGGLLVSPENDWWVGMPGVMPVTTNHIQDQRICPCAWSHSPCVYYRLPRSLTHHHYATPTSYSTISHPHNPAQNTTRPRLNNHSRMQATTVLAQAHVPHTRLLEILAKSFVIIASLYLVPFHLCILLFLSQLYHYPIPALYFSLYLLHLVVWSPDSCFSWYPSLSSIACSYCTWLTHRPRHIASCPALHI